MILRTLIPSVLLPTLLAFAPSLATAADAPPAQARGSRITGTLQQGDTTLSSGEFVDNHSIRVTAGEVVTLRMESADFDPYLIVRNTDGEQKDNDDAAEGDTAAGLTIRAAGDGSLEVSATSYAANETGAYTITVTRGGEMPAEPANPQSVASTGGPRAISGSLAEGDSRLPSGEFVDNHVVEVTAGQTLTFTMTSADFDPYLIVVNTDSTQQDNDDAAEGATTAAITATAAGDGRLIVRATSFAPGETGSYRIATRAGGAAASQASGTARAGQGGAQAFSGRLEQGDPTLRSGEYADVHTISARAGERITISMTSDEFDPYLIVFNTDGEQQDNDDAGEGSTRAEVVLTAAGDGDVRIRATSYAPKETGAYRVEVTRAGGATAQVAAGMPGGAESYNGALESGDRTLNSGEWYDAYTVAVSRGDSITVEMTSSDFDPYLIVRNTDGEQYDNDDYEGSAARSVVILTAAGDGEITVNPTSYAPGMGGNYRVQIVREGSGVQTASLTSPPQRHSGRLEQGDRELRSGEFYDTYSFEGRPGVTARVGLQSTDFDAYVIVVAPSGEQFENDDAEGQGTNSALELTLAEVGTYRVHATSFAPQTGGAYQLQIALGGSGERTAPQTAAGRGGAADSIALGRATRGTLEQGDAQDERGRFVDSYLFEAEAGQSLRFDLEANNFDCVLVVELPDGSRLENDDIDGRPDRSRVDAEVSRNGRCRITVTSYDAGMGGSYTLRVAPSTGGGGVIAQGGGGRVRAVLVGITDYQGRASNLAYCADDARRMQRALLQGASMRDADAVVLTDAQATVAGVRAAVERVGAACQPGDTFVFFYSGHGSRHDRRGGPQPTDPDAVDESLALVDGYILDDDFAQMLNSVRAGTQLIALDSCFAGGFAKDVISVPGRMGLFSSEEDVPSNVAAKFRAGGYLSLFLANGVGENLADADADGSISALEISQYVREMYRSEVKSEGALTTNASTFVRASDLGYQHLVVDRGSLPHDAPLFRRN